jgi:hypothetical protein
VRVYVASKMSGEQHNGFDILDAAAGYLRALGHEAINPADLDRSVGLGPNAEITPAVWQDAMRRDLYELMLCDALALCPNWEQSRGARLERHVAEQVGIPIYHVVPWVSFRIETAPLIVAISGYAQTGKDTAGAMMGELAGFERIAFADALKNVALASRRDLRHAVQGAGWEAVKREHPDARIFLQNLGAAVRDHVSEDAWITAALNKARPGGRYAITDCRYENEAQAVKARGGYVIRVERPGTAPANAHVSETQLDGWDFDATLRNTGSLADLKSRVRLFLSTI